MDLKSCYAAMGADYDDAMRRFQTEERVARFLKMFLEDQCIHAFRNAMAADKREEAFRAAHTLKGIAMNLSLTTLAESSGRMVNALRGGSPPENAAGLVEELEADYNSAASAIGQYLRGRLGG